MYEIDTIFYFTSESDYVTMQLHGKIAPRTIVFVSGDHPSIYKNGVRYSGMSEDEIQRIIKEYYKDDPTQLPKATNSTYGVVKIKPDCGLLISDGELSIDKTQFKGDKGDKGDQGEQGPLGQQGPQGEQGDPGEVDPELIQQIEDAIDRATDLFDDIEDEVQSTVEDLFKDSLWMNTNLKDTVQSWSNFGEDDVERYLQSIGIITAKNGNQLTFAWSSIAQNLDSITSKVARMEGKESGWDVAASEISQKVDAQGAVTAIENTYAEIANIDDIKNILRWMYSGLTSGVKADESQWISWNNLSSAISDNTKGGLANIYTEVTNLDNTYVSKAGLITLITEKSGDIWTALNSAGFLAESDLDSSIATMFAEGTGTGTYTGEKYYYCDSVGSSLAVPTYDLASGSSLTQGSYYSSSQLAAKCLLPNTNTTVTSSDVEAATLPIIIADGNDRWTIIAAKATEAALSTTKLRAAIEVGVKNDLSFINAIANQVNVSTNEVNVYLEGGGNSYKTSVDTGGLRTWKWDSLQNDYVATNKIGMDGAGFLANGSLSWNASGDITMNMSDLYILSPQDEYNTDGGLYLHSGTGPNNQYLKVRNSNDEDGDFSSVTITPLAIEIKADDYIVGTLNHGGLTLGVGSTDTITLESSNGTITANDFTVPAAGQITFSAGQTMNINNGSLLISSLDENSYLEVVNDHVRMISKIQDTDVNSQDDSLNRNNTLQVGNNGVIITSGKPSGGASSVVMYADNFTVAKGLDSDSSTMDADVINFKTSTFYAPTPQSGSDERIKDIIEELNPNVESIAAARIVNFKYKKDKNNNVKLGSIAQDWEDVFPCAVTKDDSEYLAMDYSTIALASAITAAREIVALKRENDQLKARLAAIEERLGV